VLPVVDTFFGESSLEIEMFDFGKRCLEIEMFDFGKRFTV
jgi:hypothetical protein